MPWTFYDKYGQKRSTATQVAGATQYYRGAGNPLVTVVNTASLTDLMNVSLPAQVSSTPVIRFRLKGDYLNASGANRGLQLKLILGGTTLIDVTDGSVSANSATRAAFSIEGEIQMASATVAHARVKPHIGSPSYGTTVTTGYTTGANADTAPNGHAVSPGQVVVPDVTTSARTLQIQAAHSAANVNLDCRIFDYFIEVI